MEKEKLITLVTKAQRGDTDAKNALFSEFYSDIYNFAHKTVKDEALACDITQETFLEILRTIGNLQIPEAFVSWAKKIAYHQCTRHFKKKKDVLVDEYDDGGDIFDTIEDTDTAVIPQDIYEQEDFRSTIKDMVDDLSEEQRSAVTLFYFDEMTIAKIAEIQAVSEGTVKSRLNYARKSLRKSVESYEQKHSVRLHSISLAPLFLLGLGSKSVMPLAKFTAIQQTISASVASGAAAGATATATAATGATASGTATAETATAGSGATGVATTAAKGIVVKIVAGVIALGVTATGITALLGGFKSNKTAVPADDSHNIVTETVDYNPVTESYEEEYAGYDIPQFNLLMNLGDSYETITSYNGGLYKTANGIYSGGADHYLYRESYSDERIADYELINHNKDVVYLDKQGNYIVEGTNYTFDNIKGDVIYAQNGDILSVDSNGTLYFNRVFEDTNNSFIRDYYNAVVWIELENGEKVNRVDYVEIFRGTQAANVYFEVNGRKYFRGLDCLESPYDENTQTKVDFVYNEERNMCLEGTKISNTAGYWNSGSPIMSFQGDKQHIYYYNFEYDYSEPETKFLGTERYTLTLPDGYTVDDIKRVVNTCNICVLMNDGMVFSMGDQYVFTPHSLIGDFSKTGKIVDIADDYPCLYLICDDNCIYKEILGMS